MNGLPSSGPAARWRAERTLHAEAVVVGTGVAGLSAALAMEGLRTVLVTKGALGEGGSTSLAQGGVAAALGADDAPSLHARDTRQASAGLADADRVDLLTRQGPHRVRHLLRLGARFDLGPDGDADLGREAMHSASRVLHAGGDRTGREILRALGRTVGTLPNLAVEEGARVLDLVTEAGRVRGVRAVDRTGSPVTIVADAVVLATGGPGRLYLRTTNPSDVTGDGVAMAARAGAAMADLEFVQFHPTALAAAGADPVPLVSEAVRGEGALLVDGNGRRIMEGHHPRMELAPRDVVARVIGLERASGRDVYLDARERPGSAFPERFPGIHQRCRDAGIDPATELIPVAPAEHFHMGGVATDAWGRTSLPGLWACGEVAATGVHGANRLASNSLLEGLVFGTRAGEDVLRIHDAGAAPRSARLLPKELRIPGLDEGAKGFDAGLSPWPRLRRQRAAPPVDEALRRLRAVMDRDVGLVRDEGGLRRAASLAVSLAQGAADSRAADLGLVGCLVASAALAREESRGAHFRSDHPKRRAAWARRQVVRAPASLRAHHPTPANESVSSQGRRDACGAG